MENISKRDATELANLNYQYRTSRDFVDEMETYNRHDKEYQIRQALKLCDSLRLIQKKTGIEMVSNRLLQKNALDFHDLLQSI